MYGSHKKGTFDVYISEKIQNEMTEELCLTHSGKPFDFEHFLEELNSNIPLEEVMQLPSTDDFYLYIPDIGSDSESE